MIRTDDEMFTRLQGCVDRVERLNKTITSRTEYTQRDVDNIRSYLKQRDLDHKAEVAKLKAERDAALIKLELFRDMLPINDTGSSTDMQAEEDAVYVALRGRLTDPDNYEVSGTVTGRLDSNGLTMTRWQADDPR